MECCYRPCSTITLSSSCFRDRYLEAHASSTSILIRMIGDSRESSPLMGAWRRDEFCSLHNRWQLISLSNADIHRLDTSSSVRKDSLVFTWNNTCIPLNGTILLSSRGVDHVQWSEPFGGSDEKSGNAKMADGFPFHRIEFKSSAPKLTLHTRIQVSLRAQTRYRTVSGMMNYAKAIKLLYRVENPEVAQLFDGNTDKLERELEPRKFKFVFSTLLCNIIRSSTLLNTRMPSSCYVPILIRRFLAFMRSQNDVKAMRRDYSLL